MVRPSLRSTHRVCSSKRTAVGEVVIPSSQEGITVLRYDAENTRKLSSIEAVAGERPTASRGCQSAPEAGVIAPSGEQIEIRAEDQQAVVVTVGGGLRAYAVGGRALLDGYGADEMSTSGRGQVLIPWPNRLQDGSYEFGGRRHQLPLNEPTRHIAIHGLVRWSAWSVAEREAHRVVMEHVLYPHPGYPFSLGIGIEYVLSRNGLLVRTTATNLGTHACP